MSLLPVGFGASGDDAYEITDSLRLRSASDAYLSRTFSTPTNNKKWSYSVWMKRGTLSTNQAIISSNVDGANYWDMRFNTSDQIYIQNRVSSSNLLVANTTAVYRDPSSWYHIMFVFDSANSTASNRNRLYINSVEQTLSANSGSSNASAWNVNAVQHNLGVARTLSSSGAIWAEYDGYQTEANFIDGQALAPTDFGEFDDNGTWKAKKYTGTYGTNGFYLPMKPTTQATGFNTVTYTGDGVAQSINGVGFSPDLVWIKERSSTSSHHLLDTVRGAGKYLNSNNINVEVNNATSVSSFDSDGFTTGSSGGTNQNSQTYVAWGWDAGDNQPSTGHSSILYKGSGGAISLKGFGFSPDLVWIKNRDGTAQNHMLFDSVRGPNLRIQPDNTATEFNQTGSLISFDADGFSFGTSTGNLNSTSSNYVAWGWDAGDGDPVSNTTGSINSTVKANDANGFSVVTYTGDGGADTIGHGLSVAPKFIITKTRSIVNAWNCYHASLGAGAKVFLSGTNASTASSTVWNNTSPTSTVFSVGDANTNGSGTTMVAYCFSEVSGVSKIDSYTGTGAGNHTITTGFRPGFVMIKRTDIANSWTIVDATRDPFNIADSILWADLADAEASGGTTTSVNFTDTGFELNGAGGSINTSGGTYIYIAFKGSYSDHVSPLNDTGTIDSRVKANPDKGFSIVSYEGDGSASSTVGHGLSSSASMLIVKDRQVANHWRVWHKDLSANHWLYLSLGYGERSAATDGGIRNVDANTFGFINGTTAGVEAVNTNGRDYIAYCFAEVAGYSKFDSYTGTGSSGKVVTTGFRPAFVMIKRIDADSRNWIIMDNIRDPGSVIDMPLYANLTNTEALTTTNTMTFDANGFTLTGFGADTNTNGGTYIYMAFADTADARFNFDASGNKNNWLPNNINSNGESETTYDLMKDTPSLVDENAANFATLNPLDKYTNLALSEGNLKMQNTTLLNGFAGVRATTGVFSGKWYWEVLVGAFQPARNLTTIGVDESTAGTFTVGSSVGSGGTPTSYVYYMINGNKRNNGTNSAYGATYTTGDVIGVALDLDNGTLAFYKNGVSQGTAFTGLSGTFSPSAAVYSDTVNGTYTANNTFNFGQRPFKHTPPTGFLKLNTFNLPDSTIEDGSDYFNTVLYTGNGATRSITGVGFQPDWTWFKARSAAITHLMYDSVRGATKYLQPASTSGEGTGADSQTAFNTDGFALGADTSTTGVNQNGTTYVAWNWKANGSGVSNTDGATPSTVSPNTTAGFSIVTYTGSGYLGTNLPTTVGHGLGVAPKFIFLKSRTTTEPWLTYHGSLGGTQYLFLNQTSKANSNIAFFNNTDPTSTVFSLGNSAAGNTNNANYIAYCFAPVEGYSAFGSYTGNGSTDGPFVYTGFRPAWIMTKRTNTTGQWWISDTTRDTYNAATTFLWSDTAGAEVSSSSYAFDILSNGFKLKTNYADRNGSGSTFIYMAFAENPFKNALAR